MMPMRCSSLALRRLTAALALVASLAVGASVVASQTTGADAQTDVVGGTPTTFAPRNVESAQNVHCDHCRAEAIAVQSPGQVDDPTRVPPEVSALVGEVDNAGLSTQRSDATDPTPSP